MTITTHHAFLPTEIAREDLVLFEVDDETESDEDTSDAPTDRFPTYSEPGA